MLLFKIYAVALLLVVAKADKKIQLEDIEEDNLKSEREKEYEKDRSQAPSAVSAPDLGYLKNNFIQYYHAPSPTTQQPRYVQQYAVTESPEVPVKPQYDQHQSVGYISNVPMLYIVPEYYNEQAPRARTHGVQYAPSAPQNNYPSSTESVQQHPNYIVPTFITPTANGHAPRFMQPYTTPVAYIGYPQPTLPPPQPTATPIQSYQTYQNPIVHYQTALVAPPIKNYQQINHYPNYVDQNHGQRYTSHAEVPYIPQQEFPRHYNSKAPVGDEYRTSIELPHPSPLLLKPSPPQLSHLPKALPNYRPLTKPIYATSGPVISNAFTPKPAEAYGVPFKRGPASLLDSYIPSKLQLEYLKRGYTKDAISTYEALSSGRGFQQVYPTPRYYERGFLPNQIYHTAAGGITFGHHKRASK